MKFLRFSYKPCNFASSPPVPSRARWGQARLSAFSAGVSARFDTPLRGTAVKPSRCDFLGLGRPCSTFAQTPAVDKGLRALGPDRLRDQAPFATATRTSCNLFWRSQCNTRVPYYIRTPLHTQSRTSQHVRHARARRHTNDATCIQTSSRLTGEILRHLPHPLSRPEFQG